MHRHFGMQINSSEPMYLSACLFRSCCLLLPPPITSAIIFFLRNALATCIDTNMIIMQAVALHVCSHVTHAASETLRCHATFEAGEQQQQQQQQPCSETSEHSSKKHQHWAWTLSQPRAMVLYCSMQSMQYNQHLLHGLLQAMHLLHGSGHIPYSDAQHQIDC